MLNKFGKISVGAASILLGLGLVGTVNHTANAASVVPNSAAVWMRGTVHVSYVPGHPHSKILLWDGSGHGTGRFISGNTNWKVNARKWINGKLYYRIGNDRQWVQADYVNDVNASVIANYFVVHVSNAHGATARLYNGDGTLSGLTIRTNSNWKGFEARRINGEVYYRLGRDNQWIPAKDVSVIAGQPNVEQGNTTTNSGRSNASTSHKGSNSSSNVSNHNHSTGSNTSTRPTAQINNIDVSSWFDPTPMEYLNLQNSFDDIVDAIVDSHGAMSGDAVITYKNINHTIADSQSAARQAVRDWLANNPDDNVATKKFIVVPDDVKTGKKLYCFQGNGAAVVSLGRAIHINF